jgi:hypothetical protein
LDTKNSSNYSINVQAEMAIGFETDPHFNKVVTKITSCDHRYPDCCGLPEAQRRVWRVMKGNWGRARRQAKKLKIAFFIFFVSCLRAADPARLRLSQYMRRPPAASGQSRPVLRRCDTT